MLLSLVLVLVLASAAAGPSPAAAFATAESDVAAREAALSRCRRASLRWLDQYRRGVVGCFAWGLRTADPEDAVRCRRDRLVRFESRLAHIEMDARRHGVTCAASELTAAAARRSWMAALLVDMAPPASNCRPTRLRALGRFASAGARCWALPVDRTDGSTVGECLASATQRFAEAWANDPDGGCDALAYIEVIARVLDGLSDDAAEQSSRCGNGTIEGIEQCDDGNARASDGCDARCRVESCDTATDEVPYCRYCRPNASIDAAGECVCDAGYAAVGDECLDRDECAAGEAVCPAGSACVNVPGTYACAVPCTKEGLERAIATCGGPTRFATFACRDRRIAIANDGGWGNRRVRCNGLVIDGLDRNVTFELDPPCFEVAGAACPDVDDGAGFLLLEGNDITVRNMTVRWFFDGIQSRGRDNTVEAVTFVRQCDDSITNAQSAVGTLFRDLVVKDGCDKCSQNFGDPALTSPDAASRDRYNAIFDRVDFIGCGQPLRMTESGRFLLSDVHMFTRRRSPFACRGPFFSSPLPDSLFVTLNDSIVTRCRRGVRFGGAAQGLLDGNLVEKSVFAGVRVFRSARASLTRNRILSNGGGMAVNGGGAGVVVADDAVVDLGGGSVEIDGTSITSEGRNLLCGNRGSSSTRLEVDASLMAGAAAPAPAADNWWCESDPSRLIAGAVEFVPFADFPR